MAFSKKSIVFSIVILVFFCLAAGCTGTSSQGSPAPVMSEVSFYEPYPLAFSNAFYQQQIPSVSYDLINPSSEPVTVRITSDFPGYSTPSVDTLTLQPGESETVDHVIRFDPQKIGSIHSTTKLNLATKTEYLSGSDWKTINEQTALIEVYPEDSMVWSIADSDGNTTALDEYIAVFVTPQSPAVMELLASAKEYATTSYDSRYADYGLERSLQGYQYSGSSKKDYAEYSALQVKAVYNALKYNYKVSYVNTPVGISLTNNVQHINVPDVSLKLASANCVDGSVLFASALEAMGMNPYLILYPDHAYVAWDTDSEGTAQEALETTMIGSADFDDAYATGTEEFISNLDKFSRDTAGNGYQIISISDARKNGIYPLK